MEAKLAPSAPGTARLEAFSDGVLAIVITLMILEIKLPHLAPHPTNQEAWQGLVPIVPKLLAYALSFLMIAIFWVNHHQLVHSIRSSTRALLWWNNLWLFFVCLLPFPTAFLGENPTLEVAACLFGLELFFCALSFFLMRWYCWKADLFLPQVPKEETRRLLRKSMLAPSFYLVSAVLPFWSMRLAYAIFIAIPILFVVSSIKGLRK